jgi:hypothetical protein
MRMRRLVKPGIEKCRIGNTMIDTHLDASQNEKPDQHLVYVSLQSRQIDAHSLTPLCSAQETSKSAATGTFGRRI